MREREVWLKVIDTGAVELVQAQPRSMSPAGSFRKTLQHPHHSAAQNRALGGTSPLHPGQSVTG